MIMKQFALNCLTQYVVISFGTAVVVFTVLVKADYW